MALIKCSERRQSKFLCFYERHVFSMVGLNCGIVGVILGCIFMGKKKLSNVGFALSLVAGISSILIIFFEVVVVAGGTIGGIAFYNNYQEKKQQEEEKTIESREDAFNSYNNKITNEINNDSVLTQEQKDMLNASVETNKNNINNRVNAINESKKVIKANQETTLGLYCALPYLKEKISDLEEIPGSASEMRLLIKPYNVEAVYDMKYLNSDGGRFATPGRLKTKH